MLNNYLNRPRNKAFLGSIISGVIGIGTSIFGAAKQKEAQRQQYRLQRNMELRNTGLTSAANLIKAYSNADELDEEFKNRFLRFGGRRKALFGDYIPNYAAPTVESYAYKLGGRKRFEGGGDTKTSNTSSNGWNWSNADTNALISGLSSAGSNLATSLIGQATQRANYINSINPLIGDRNSDKTIYDSAARSELLNNYYRTSTLRCGGKRYKR